MWNELQTKNGKPDLNKAAPNEDDIHRNLSQTNLKGSGCRIITPTMLGTNLNEEAFNKEAQSFFKDFRGLIIGVEHATVVYRATSSYVYVRPAPDLQNTQTEIDNQVQLEVIQGDDGSYALKVFGESNQDLSVVGNFIMLLR
ncbi:hypothetical protein [Moorena sp. SIO4G3]|uniref:hypothetical protein n=1 Tax=Moorena sp. SIO4G3 TaxID=2607821 RepID=UPI00142A68EE|nr:hypothetical protein [Moorena sp. SIO4G3]NEO80991.1 hypothetical protein [Moorena sp. SIO4G3]